jgi:hypothetical protein
MRVFAAMELAAACLALTGLLAGCGTPKVAHAKHELPIAVETTASATPGFTQGKAAVRAVRGTVYHWNGKWKRLHAEEKITAGENLWTGVDGSADVFLADSGSVLRVEPGTHLVIERLEYQGERDSAICQTRLNIKTGRIRGNIGRPSSSSTYELETPTALLRSIPERRAIYEIGTDGAYRVEQGIVSLTEDGKELFLTSPAFRPAVAAGPPPECAVHHVKMNRKTVPIIYGLMKFPPGYSEDASRFFPHAGNLYAGCVVTSRKEDFAWVCDSCVVAAMKYKPRNFAENLEPEGLWPKRKF